MLSLKEFKQLVKTSPLIQVKGATVKSEISTGFVSFEWRGTDTGNYFCGCVNEENLKTAKFTASNEIAFQLANLVKNEVVVNNFYTSFSFWHVVKIPVT